MLYIFCKTNQINLSTVTTLTYLKESYLHAVNNSLAFVGKTFGIGSNLHFLYSSSPHSDFFRCAQRAPKNETKKKKKKNTVLLERYLIIDVNQKKKERKKYIKRLGMDSKFNAGKFLKKFQIFTARI